MTDPDVSPTLTDLAGQVARAERAALIHNAGSLAAAGALRLGAALGLAVLGLLLPWSSDADDATQDAFAHTAALPTIALLTVAGGVVLLAWHVAVPEPLPRAILRGVIYVGGVASLIAGLMAAHARRPDHHLWWGPVLFTCALLAAIVIAATMHGQDEASGQLLGYDRLPSTPALQADVHRRLLDRLNAGPAYGVPALLGAGGLGVAAAGLTTTWQRLAGGIVTTLAGHPLVWHGFELSSTQRVRWAVAAGLVAVLAAAAVPVVRRALPVLMLAAGAATVVLTATTMAAIPVQGSKSAIGVGPGAWLTLAGGAVAALCGVVLIAPSLRGRFVPAATVLIAVLAAGAVVQQPPARAAGGRADGGAQRVFGSGHADDRRLGGPADRADFYGAGTVSVGAGLDGTALPDATTSVDGDGHGRVWFVTSRSSDPYDDDVPRGDLIEEVVHGHALPVTVTHGADIVRLIGVTGTRAIALCYENDNYFVSLIDLRLDEVSLDPWGRSSGYSHVAPVVLHTNPYPEPGELKATSIVVDPVADGSVVVTVEPARQAYLVDAATVRGSARWRLTKLPGAGSALQVHGPGGTTYQGNGRLNGGALQRRDAAGHLQVVLGGVSDQRCGLSRDPLRSTLRGLDLETVGTSLATRVVAVDRASNVWLPLGPLHQPGQLYVLTADGVLRTMPGAWRKTSAVQLTADGSLLVTTGAVAGHSAGTYRIDDPPAEARAAAPLPAVPTGCVSDNHISPPATEGRTVREIARVSVPDTADSAIVDGRGTTIYVAGVQQEWDYNWSLKRIVPGTGITTVYTAHHAAFDRLVPDGRGGMWWTQFVPPRSDRIGIGPGAIGHIDASGRARIVSARAMPLIQVSPDYAVHTCPDPDDGSLWWRVDPHPTWNRTRQDGRTSTVAYRGECPVLGGGTGYITGKAGVQRITGTGPGPTILGAPGGRRLSVPSGVAARAPSTDFDASGQCAATSDGALLLAKDGYLVRIERSGRVRVLAGPSDGLPAQDDTQQLLVLGRQLFITTGDGRVDAVDVS